MGSPSYRLATAITVPSTGEFLLVRQPPPPSLPEEEYGRYVDSDLYDLPSAPLRSLAGEPRTDVDIGDADSVAGRIDLSRLDVFAALEQILDQFDLPDGMCGEWRLLKYVEEAEFGPDAGVNTVFISGSLESKMDGLQESFKWMSKECALSLLCEAKPCSDRIGPYAYIGLLKSDQSSNCTAAPALPSQDYPPGITLVPMKSKTLQPFRTTNLVVVQATNGAGGLRRSDFVASADALLIDPGCCSQVHAEEGMHGYMNLLSGNWDESQFVTPFAEQSLESQTIVEETPPLKGKKGARNFSEKEDILLVKAWLEISQDAVHGNEQSRTSYWQRIHDHYHSHKDFVSDRNVNSLSHRWGVIQESVNRFCGWYAQIQNMRQSGVSTQDKVQQACIVYKDKDPKGKSFPFLHCWNVLQHAQKWSDIGSQKKQKTCSNSSPRSSTPGTNESHHIEEEEGVTHTSPLKTTHRPEGKKKAKERGKNIVCQGENLYNDTLEKFWSKKEKVEEFKEMRKKERNDERLAIEKQRLELEKQQFEFKRNMEDERLINMDLSGMSERQQMFYRSMQDEIIARRYGTGGSSN